MIDEMMKDLQIDDIEGMMSLEVIVINMTCQRVSFKSGMEATNARVYRVHKMGDTIFGQHESIDGPTHRWITVAWQMDRGDYPFRWVEVDDRAAFPIRERRGVDVHD